MILRQGHSLKLKKVSSKTYFIVSKDTSDHVDWKKKKKCWGHRTHSLIRANHLIIVSSHSIHVHVLAFVWKTMGQCL